MPSALVSNLLKCFFSDLEGQPGPEGLVPHGPAARCRDEQLQISARALLPIEPRDDLRRRDDQPREATDLEAQHLWIRRNPEVHQLCLVSRKFTSTLIGWGFQIYIKKWAHPGLFLSNFHLF